MHYRDNPQQRLRHHIKWTGFTPPNWTDFAPPLTVPTLQKGAVVVPGNLPADKRDGARRAVEKRGAWLLFLPPYAPDFNPIELAFSKFKAHMKRLKPRTIDDLWKAAGNVCGLFNHAHCRNFLVADGYASE